MSEFGGRDIPGTPGSSDVADAHDEIAADGTTMRRHASTEERPDESGDTGLDERVVRLDIPARPVLGPTEKQEPAPDLFQVSSWEPGVGEASDTEAGADREDLDTGPTEIPERTTEEPHGGSDFRITEAREDLTRAQTALNDIISELDRLDDMQKEMAAELRTDTERLQELLQLVAADLASGKSVSLGLAVSVSVRVEMVQEAAKEEANKADGECKRLLEQVLQKLGQIGRALLSMNIHLLPIKEWSVSGEASALIVKGNIKVTFGK
jgi:hypothetical protein